MQRSDNVGTILEGFSAFPDVQTTSNFSNMLVSNHHGRTFDSHTAHTLVLGADMSRTKIPLEAIGEQGDPKRAVNLPRMASVMTFPQLKSPDHRITPSFDPQSRAGMAAHLTEQVKYRLPVLVNKLSKKICA